MADEKRELVGVDDRDLTRDEPPVAQAFDPAQARGRRNVDLGGEFLVGQRGIALELVQKSHVDVVQIFHVFMIKEIKFSVPQVPEDNFLKAVK